MGIKLYYERDGIEIWHGDCRHVSVWLKVKGYKFSTIITDPPYGLEFMGKEWDHGVPGVPFWEKFMEIVHPGGVLLSFGGTRTHHRLMCAIEDAKWEIRDCLMYLYGTGFPKSYNISKGIDKKSGEELDYIEREYRSAFNTSGTHQAFEGETHSRPVKFAIPTTDAAKQWDGYGTALKPAWEPILLAMKPRDGTFVNNALEYGVAGLNVDGGRITTQENLSGGAYAKDGSDRYDGDENWRFKRKGGAGEYQQPKGRWPANILLDEIAAGVLDEQTGISGSGKYKPRSKNRTVTQFDPAAGWNQHSMNPNNANAPDDYGDTGGASRFFYTAKSSKSERNSGCEGLYWQRDGDSSIGFKIVDQVVWETLPKRQRAEGNIHPTVKPVKLLEYLSTLTKMPTDTDWVLDPFLGSGSTLVACVKTGRRGVGIELSEEYCEIAAKRVDEVINCQD